MLLKYAMKARRSTVEISDMVFERQEEM